MAKHAYLIIAHNEFEVLEYLLKSLDYKENDIFLHIDKKTKNFPIDRLRKCVNYSTLNILDNRVNVKWANFTQIECELRLLEASIAGNYSYYHLLSGVDLPIKSQKEIHDFFDNCDNKQFIHFDSPQIEPDYLKRVNKYWLIIEREKKFFSKVISKFLLGIQCCINRIDKSTLEYQKGAQWFSITNDLATYVVRNRPFIERNFKHTLAGDEMFLQTLVTNSVYKEMLYDSRKVDDYGAIKREIDWNRGNPYVYTKNDYPMLMNSDNFFARKFSWNKDSEIIKMIFESIKIL